LSSESLEPLIGFLVHLELNHGSKTEFLTKIKKLHKRYHLSISGQTLVCHNSSADWVREVFKPCRDSWCLIA